MQTSPKRVAAPLAGRLVQRAASWLLCAVILAGGAVVGTAAVIGAPPAGAAEPSPSSAAQTVKYYIVGHTGTTEREFLFQIATRTLGDGRRYMEIFELNKARPQPGGGRLEDPYVLMPGWILILPADAEGPGVVIGPPPVFGSGVAEPPMGPAAAPPADSGDGLIRAVALVLVAVILGTALHRLRLLRRERQTALPALARATPVEFASADQIPELPTPAGGASSPVRPARLDEPTIEIPVRPTRQRPTSERPASERPASERPASERPADDSTASDSTAGDERRRRLDRPSNPAGQPATSVRPTEPTSTRVEVSLTTGSDRLTIRLIGARPGAGDAILGRGEDRPQRSGGAVVRLGDAGPDTLWIDLAASPDVVRIGGNPAGVHRLCAAIARQLSRAGVATVVVGDVPGVMGMVSRAVASPDQVIDEAVTAQLLVVFLTDPAPADVPALHELVTRRRPRVVPVVVGSGPRSRWSIDVA